MADELKDLKSVLRSLVVSSPTQMDVRTLFRDYRNMVGAPIPLARYGYRDPIAFLQERCSDCFLFTGLPSNPVLTLIVPDTLKHIDKFVQKQKISSSCKFRSKRRSIPQCIINPPEQDLVCKTFIKSAPSITAEEKPKIPEDKVQPKPVVKAPDIANHNNENDVKQQNTVTSNDVKNFLKKRLPMYNSLHNFEEPQSERGTVSVSQDDDSGKHTSSSGNSTKALQFDVLKSEIMELITSAPDGVWCTDLIRLYRERYKRELNFARFGYTSILSVAYTLEDVQITRPVDTGDWLLQNRRSAAHAPPALRVRRLQRSEPHHDPAPDADDALPGIDFDPDVFPEDCVHFMESIPTMSLADCRPGAMLEVIVGEVYSPSHFWLIRLGENYNIAMEDMMDEMTQYYNGPGRQRALARGAVRVGHYCSSLYDHDWHRSLIVKIVDSDTVKVRHVDYGTVDTVAVSELKPLRRHWAALPAQALRARLAAVRPSAAGRRWPHAAAAYFLRLVRDTRLVANVVAIDAEEDVVETLLIDTRGAEDVCVSGALIRGGHADARPDCALRTAECYLFPRFEALENGDTPNYAEIRAYLRDGIALDYVEAYRQHVPLCLPPAPPARVPFQPPARVPFQPPARVPFQPPARVPFEPPARVPFEPPGRVPFEPPARVPFEPPGRVPFEPPARVPFEPPARVPFEPPGRVPVEPPGRVHRPLPAPAPPPPSDTPSDSDDSYDAVSLATSSTDTSPSELATRIPLLWPSATTPSVAPLLKKTSSPDRECQENPSFETSSPTHVNSPPTPAAASPALAVPSLVPAAPSPSPEVSSVVPAAPSPSPEVAARFPPGAVFPLAPVFAPPPGAQAGGLWFGPYAAPPGVVQLSVAECDTYHMLSRVNPAAAHWYMAGTLGRAMGCPMPQGVPPLQGPPMGPPGSSGMLGPPVPMSHPSLLGSGQFGPPGRFGPPGMFRPPGGIRPPGEIRPPPGFGV